jgi:hypothetical protein
MRLKPRKCVAPIYALSVSIECPMVCGRLHDARRHILSVECLRLTGSEAEHFGYYFFHFLFCFNGR